MMFSVTEHIKAKLTEALEQLTEDSKNTGFLFFERQKAKWSLNFGRIQTWGILLQEMKALEAARKHSKNPTYRISQPVFS